MLIFSDWILIKQFIVSSNRFSSKCFLGEWVVSFCLSHDEKRVLSRDGYEKKCLESVEFQEMRTPWIWKFFSHMVEYKRLSENSTSILERDLQKHEREVYRKMKVCILEINVEDDFVDFNWDLRYPQQRGIIRKKGWSFGTSYAWEGANDFP